MTLNDLQQLLVVSEASKPDQVKALIMACIESGIVAGAMIVSTVAELGYDKRHVAIILKTSAGPNPSLRDWYQTEDGEYRLH